MSEVKIISDPYKSIIEYQRLNEMTGEWENNKNSNSGLLDIKFIKGFFPFNVEAIVDLIIDEFRSGDEKVKIVFEGTDDEFDDLNAVCDSENYRDRVIVERSSLSLKNARDIFTEVKSKFKEVDELVRVDSSSADNDIDRERRQFTEVSAETIPICVLGNYSSGKSTFINALIGYEILPSGDQPLTAKIHKIERSEFDDRASIRIEYDGSETELLFKGSEKPAIPEVSDSALFDALREETDSLEEYSLILCVNKALGVLNRIKDDKLGDIIKIKIPFSKKCEFGIESHKFVIFDTPGSNTASNDHHLTVLKSAMNDLSNGLPIYVCNSFDTTDNAQLCKDIKELKELDSRFSMIVVNRADEANLVNFSEEEVMNKAVPKMLYSGGLYYVSSIVGLGAKNNGKFFDKHYNKIFKNNRSSFEDPEDENYTRLFEYYICPKHIKDEAVKKSEECDNRLLANSGLYWVEKEIENFAGKYSPYNKCRQALIYLNKAMDKIETKLAETKALYTREKSNFESQLDEGKRLLVNELDECSERLKNDFFDKFPEVMASTIESSNIPIDKEYLDELKELYQTNKDQCSYTDQVEMLSDTQKNFFDNFKNIKVPSDMKEMREKGREILNNVKEVVGQEIDLVRTQKELDSNTSNEILSLVINRFNDVMNTAQSELNNSSISYWSKRSTDMRHELIKVVTGSPTLDDERKNALADIISKYESISFDKRAEEIFVFENFKPRLRVRGIPLLENNRLNLSKLQKSYNKQIEQGINDLFDRLRKAHKDVFSSWVNELLKKTKESLTDFNPKLHELANFIDNKTLLINLLESSQERLHNIADEIAELMSWQEV